MNNNIIKEHFENVFGAIHAIGDYFVTKRNKKEEAKVTDISVAQEFFSFYLNDENDNHLTTLWGARYEFPIEKLGETPANLWKEWKKKIDDEKRETAEWEKKVKALKKTPEVKEYLKLTDAF